ncbi:MAG: sigma factor-like helix-turn-helix DNA-binding protein [Candidatus Faecousia sp.]|nr:sigma factor-like helix-turn-helix DNA-binding protein [Candidatus Faecousia sp.]
MAYVPPSDWELKDFIRDHADAVYRSCGFLTLGRGDSGEMTREIFLKILNRGMEFRSEQEARAWMILTAYQMGRKVSKDAPVSEQGKELQKLKRKDRLVALLYYCEGYRKKEIADYLGCTEASVRRRLARVKRLLDVDEQEDSAQEEIPEEPAEAVSAEKQTPDEETPQEEASQEAAQKEISQEETPQEEAPEEGTPQEEAPKASREEETAEEANPGEEAADEASGLAQRGGEAEC